MSVCNFPSLEGKPKSFHNVSDSINIQFTMHSGRCLVPTQYIDSCIIFFLFSLKCSCFHTLKSEVFSLISHLLLFFNSNRKLTRDWVTILSSIESNINVSDLNSQILTVMVSSESVVIRADKGLYQMLHSNLSHHSAHY